MAATLSLFPGPQGPALGLQRLSLGEDLLVLSLLNQKLGGGRYICTSQKNVNTGGVRSGAESLHRPDLRVLNLGPAVRVGQKYIRTLSTLEDHLDITFLAVGGVDNVADLNTPSRTHQDTR